MKIGKYTYGTNNITVLYDSPKNLEIGAFCSIASNCKIYLSKLRCHFNSI